MNQEIINCRYKTCLVLEYFEKLKSVALVSRTWHDEVETFKKYRQTTQRLSAQHSCKKCLTSKKKKYSSMIIILKVCCHWNVKVCSLSNSFFHFSLLKKTTFCKAVFIVTKTPSSDLLWFEPLLPYKKAGKYE